MNLKKKIEVVMLPANRQDLSYIGMYIDTINLVYNDHKTDIDRGVPQHLYFLSDEKIEDDDWCLVKNKIISLFKYKKNTCEEVFCKKIIATTDKTLTYFVAHTDCNGLGCDKCLEHALPQPSPQFIQKYIEEWNKGNKIQWVNVEYEFKNIHFNLELKEHSKSEDKCYNSPLNTEMYLKDESHNYILGYLEQRDLNGGGQFRIKNPKEDDFLNGGRGCALKDLYYLTLKVDKNNYITITKIKDSWTREEVKDFSTKLRWFINENQRTIAEVDKWIEDNL